jgi:hypothetical protein
VTTLTFNDEDHSYWWGKRRLLSVTQILKMAGLIKTGFFSDEAALRGTYVHLAAQLLDDGKLDESTIDPAIAPYLDAYRQFLTLCKPKWTYIETRLADPDVGFAGAVDRVGTLLVGKKRKTCVVDLKSGSTAPFHAIQTAGYSALVVRDRLKHGAAISHAVKIGRVAVYLTKKGTFTMKEYTDERDKVIFQAALNLVLFREVHGLL